MAMTPNKPSVFDPKAPNKKPEQGPLKGHGKGGTPSRPNTAKRKR